MLNQVVLVGRLMDDPRDLEPNRKFTNIKLAIPRSFKNNEGEYETDYIDCELWETVAQSTINYCKKGDIIGVKGRLQSYTTDNGDNIIYKTKVVAEKVTFLSSNSNSN